MKHAKRIGALICVIAICFTLTVAPSAHAAGGLIPQNFGAWISAGLMSLNIIGQSLMPAPGPVDPYFRWLASPASATQSYEYPVTSSVIQDYLNASTVVVRQGVTTIDGVEYDEVFVEPGTFTGGLKTNLFDFKTKWNIISGQSGISLASGAGHVDGMPMFKIGSQFTSQIFGPTAIQPGISFSMGNIPINMIQSGSKVSIDADKYGVNQHITTINATSGSRYFSLNVSGDTISAGTFTSKISTSNSPFTGSGFGWGKGTSIYDDDAFDYGYTSGIVPTDETEIPEDYGLSIQIPHDQLQTFYNTYPQYNVDNSVINIQQDGIDIDELTQAIFDQITSMEDIKAEWKAEEEPVPPEPEPPGPAEDLLTGVNTIIGQQNTQISQNKQDLQIQQQQLQQQQQQLQQQQQISENTSDIKDAIENATEVPTAEQLPDFKFDLRELFPFCIPFDIYRLLSSFDAEPQAPHVQLPIVIESIGFNYTLDLDFSSWNPVAQAMRTAELIVYAIGLAWATGKVIKW